MSEGEKRDDNSELLPSNGDGPFCSVLFLKNQQFTFSPFYFADLVIFQNQSYLRFLSVIVIYYFLISNIISIASHSTPSNKNVEFVVRDGDDVDV